ncbi:hypothetical protein RFI_28102, partial [Reticulomyxa filosa]
NIKRVEMPGKSDEELANITWKVYEKFRYRSVFTKNQTLQGLIRTEYQCSKCEQRITVLFDEFTVLKIPIINSKKNVSFENCLKEYIKPQLFKNNIRECSNCKRERFTKETKTIYYPPEYLILAVDRFNLDTMEKNYANVKPCLLLDFSPFSARCNTISNSTVS